MSSKEKSKETKEYEENFVRSLEVSMMCVMNILHRFREEQKRNNSPVALIGEPDLFSAFNAIMFVYKQTCDQFNVKRKTLDEINDSFHAVCANE